MNPVTEEQKMNTTKTLAIVGFVVLIVFTVWLAVQIVSYIPSAFSSLASIADSIYNRNESKEFLVANEKSMVNTGDVFTISWSEQRQKGTYEISFVCHEGVAVEARLNGQAISEIPCDTEVDLGTRTSLEVRLLSEKDRFADVAYTVFFIPDNTDSPIVSKQNRVTVVNASIPTTGRPEGEVAGETNEEEEEETPVVTTPTTPTPKPPVYIEEVVYAIPVSNPNGVTDLKVTFLGVGHITNNNVFNNTGTIRLGQKGAFQFEVKNIGTKTADNWSYEAELPMGIDYTSGAQQALRPNERAIITLGFEGVTKTGTETFGVTTHASGDIQNSNNSFNWAVFIVR